VAFDLAPPFPLSPLRLATRPSPRFPPATLAALPLARSLRMKDLFTAFEQTAAGPAVRQAFFARTLFGFRNVCLQPLEARRTQKNLQ